MPRYPFLPGIWTSSAVSRTTRRSGVTISSWNVSGKGTMDGRLCRSRPHLSGRFDDLINAAFHVKRLLRNVIVLAFQHLAEAAHRVCNLHIASLQAGKLLGNVKRLREELLNFARARHDYFLVFAEFIDTQNGNDVLQVIISLQNFLYALGHIVVLLPDDSGIENARGGSQRINRR